MSERYGWVWCHVCDCPVWALMSMLGKKWYSEDCCHNWKSEK